jgi:hypothetical protein
MMVQTSKIGVTVSQCPCTPRCMLSSMSLAWHHRSSGRFKARHPTYGNLNVNGLIKQKERQKQKVLQQRMQAQSGIFQRSNSTLKKTKGKQVGSTRHQRGTRESGCTSKEGNKQRRLRLDASCFSNYRDKSLELRRRDLRVNGADLYVARVTKNGMGNAKPCWRCLEWCKWSGVCDLHIFRVVRHTYATFLMHR